MMISKEIRIRGRDEIFARQGGKYVIASGERTAKPPNGDLASEIHLSRVDVNSSHVSSSK